MSSLADRCLIAEACDCIMPRFLEQVPSVQALMSPPLRRWLWQRAWSVDAMIAQLEFMHSRNRARAHAFQLWQRFAADSYNAERQNRFVWASKALEDDSVARKRKRRRVL